MTLKTIRIGTRKSPLALWQTNYIAGMLEKKNFRVEIIPIQTLGDKVTGVPLPAIGAKGVFTLELEDALRKYQIDLAVHSAKDVQTDLPDDMALLGFTQRGIAEDVLISHKKNIVIEDKNISICIGTSSARRKALLKFYYPHVIIVDIRGNLQTRIRKMSEGKCDALILAGAGVERLGFNAMIVKKFSLNKWLPAPGQGALAVECLKENLSVFKEVRKIINHRLTKICVTAERAFLSKMGGGCSKPVFCLARIKNGKLEITGGALDPEGEKMVRQRISGSVLRAVTLGLQLAGKVLKMGGGGM